MAAGFVEVSVAAAPDATWKIVGDFASVPDWVPGIESFRLEGDDRFVGMFGTEVRERLLSCNEIARTMTYSVIGAPIGSHRATVTVTPDGEGSKVTWAYEVTPDEMAPILRDIYQQALAPLEAKLAE
jgi:mxaD protein